MRCLQLYMPVLPDVFFFFLFFHCDNYKRHSHKHGTNHHSPLIYCCHAQIACDSADGEHCVYAEKKQAFSQIVPVFMSDIFAYGRSRCSHIAYTHCGGTGVALRICASYAYFLNASTCAPQAREMIQLQRILSSYGINAAAKSVTASNRITICRLWSALPLKI